MRSTWASILNIEHIWGMVLNKQSLIHKIMKFNFVNYIRNLSSISHFNKSNSIKPMKAYKSFVMSFKKLCRELKFSLPFFHFTRSDMLKNFLQFLIFYDLSHHFTSMHNILNINKHLWTLPFIYKFVYLYIFTYIQLAY